MPNLLATFEDILRASGGGAKCASLELRTRDDRYSDVRLLFSDRAWLESAEGGRLVDAFQAHPAIESAQRRKSAISLRLTDAFLADLEHRLATGQPGILETSDLLAGRRTTVGFVGPNTNKALHVGHLRNIVLGEALASLLEEAGARVLRQSLIGDIGRRVCESMAGYKTFHDGSDPQTAGLKPDLFVNLCYRDSTSRLAEEQPEEMADPNAEERIVQGDLADQLMEQWRRGDPQVLRLWEKLRGWVLAGHRQTLARLGVYLDRCDFESSGMHRATALLQGGLERGILERGRGEAILFRSGRPGYDTMVLLREDGFPTEHARLLAVYDHLLDDIYPRWVYVEVAGIEWQPSALVLRELIERLWPGPRNAVHVRVFHGMLMADDEKKVSSSTGEPPLLDDFLDDVQEIPRIRALSDLSRGAIEPSVLADLVVRGYFLVPPAARPMSFSWERLLDEHQNPGWSFARAWCRARRDWRAGDPPGDSSGQPSSRVAIVQSQGFRRILLQSVEQLDIGGVTRFLRGFCESYLAAPVAPGLDRAAAEILGKVLRSLGFLAGKSSDAEAGWGKSPP